MMRIICSPYDLGRRDHGMGEMADRFLDAGALDLLRSTGADVETVFVQPPERRSMRAECAMVSKHAS